MIAFCIIDDIHTYANDEIKTTITNIADHTISNLLTKGYNVFVDKDEEVLLQKSKDFSHVVVMSPGTEFINGTDFFEHLEELIQHDFFVAGHVLDRSEYDAYYELHHQCYVINMAHYKALQCPTVGVLERGIQHTQTVPIRSIDNYHDTYTPFTVRKGNTEQTYNNRCHGWNLISTAFDNNLNVLVFNERLRNSKKHYYPESEKDFYKCKDYIDYKLNHCEFDFVHTNNTEWATGIYSEYEQVVVPASGLLYTDLVKCGTIVFYDYNQRALDYWKSACPRKDGIEYKFVKANLLDNIDLINHLKSDARTFVNLSNIFSYEGTAARYSLKHRLLAQENLEAALIGHIKDIRINYTQKANKDILNIACWH